MAAAAAADTGPPFRFSRMGPKGINRQPGDGHPQEAGQRDGGRRREAPASIPAGYTYLGQFVDHDLTFDKTTVTLGSNISPAMLLQARSPSLDLDSLYGAGPGRSRSRRSSTKPTACT